MKIRKNLIKHLENNLKTFSGGTENSLYVVDSETIKIFENYYFVDWRDPLNRWTFYLYFNKKHIILEYYNYKLGDAKNKTENLKLDILSDKYFKLFCSSCFETRLLGITLLTKEIKKLWDLV